MTTAVLHFDINQTILPIDSIQDKSIDEVLSHACAKSQHSMYPWDFNHSPMTYHHYVEAMLQVPWRFFKVFTGQYTDWWGETSERSYGIYVRKRSLGVQTNIDPMGDMLWSSEVYMGNKPGQNYGLRVAPARRVFDFITHMFEAGKEYLSPVRQTAF